MDLETMNKLLAVGCQNGASDIHFRPGDPPIYRVDGVLRQLKTGKLTPAQTREIAMNLLGASDEASRVDKLREWDGSYALPGISRFRVNLYRQRGSLSAVLRIIPADVPTVDALQLPPVVKTIAAIDRGLVVVTGATGSGKTSTLAAMIDHINRTANKHILTIEDPIEYLHKNMQASVSQREIGIDTENFNTALRAALRQDPDVILVGEMRDIETIDIALKAAETGHLVLATVHTVDAATTISRLVSNFPAEEQHMVRLRLADNLKASISQRLLPRTDGKGRVLAMEIMVQTKNIQEHIRDASKTNSIKDVLEKGNDTYGMQSFDQHLTRLYKSGVISLDAALSAASNPADFQRALSFQ